MRSRSLFTSFLSMALAALLLAGCANQMEPATRAIADIEAAIGAAGADAAQFIPDELQAVTGGLADLKAKFDQKDYKGVMAAAPALLAQAQALAGSAATARAAAEAAQAAALEAMNAEWTTLSGTLPAAVAAIESRVNVLSKSKKLPAGLDAATFDSVKTGLADAKSLWDQATAAQAAGNVEAAVTAARQVKEKADAALAALGMTAG
jgi:trimeric autotransporter adhesin